MFTLDSEGERLTLDLFKGEKNYEDFLREFLVSLLQQIMSLNHIYKLNDLQVEALWAFLKGFLFDRPMTPLSQDCLAGQSLNFLIVFGVFETSQNDSDLDSLERLVFDYNNFSMERISLTKLQQLVTCYHHEPIRPDSTPNATRK